ncbi:MAG: ribonuclease P protein component [Micrococcales bacterium]|nr:MAG: ribonuclease P protein component [Micrococcales bacterium]PIE27023.1 MAG: ribonuclease P protein component [Micrococcales bacterium]
MLPAAHRMRRSQEFADTVRRGRRCGREHLVVHYHLAHDQDAAPPLVGFIVSRAVGGSVDRNRVKRRLRHQIALRLPVLPCGGRFVVRARPAAGHAASHELGNELDACFARWGLS